MEQNEFVFVFLNYYPDITWLFNNLWLQISVVISVFTVTFRRCRYFYIMLTVVVITRTELAATENTDFFTALIITASVSQFKAGRLIKSADRLWIFATSVDSFTQRTIT